MLIRLCGWAGWFAPVLFATPRRQVFSRPEIVSMIRNYHNHKPQTTPCLKMGLTARKPVFGVSDKASVKPVSSATEISYKIEISPVTSKHMILSKKRIPKVLIRLCGWAGWFAPVLFATPRRQVFSRPEIVSMIRNYHNHKPQTTL